MSKALTDNLFDKEVTQYKGYVLIDFWAQWCGPCRQLAPIIDEISSELEGKVNVYKMDIDSNTETPAKLGVRSIPTLMLFQNGELIATKVGSSSKSALLKWIDEETANG